MSEMGSGLTIVDEEPDEPEGVDSEPDSPAGGM
jgi:hypothetical protein